MSDTYEEINILRATAHENPLASVPEGHLTLSHEIVGNISRRQLEELMTQDGIATENVNGFAFVDAFMEKVMQLVMAGYRVHGKWLHSSIVLSGTVPAERLGHHAHPGEVGVKVSFNLAKRSREMVDRLPVSIHDDIASGAPIIQSITNPLVGTPDTVNAGGMVMIRGLNISIEGERTADIGVFLTPVGGGAVVHIAAGKFAPNTPGKVQFVLPPEVTPGEWMVRLATQTSGGKKLRFTKEVRSYTYGMPVQIL
jgi:hypothetical protein